MGTFRIFALGQLDELDVAGENAECPHFRQRSSSCWVRIGPYFSSSRFAIASAT